MQKDMLGELKGRKDM